MRRWIVALVLCSSAGIARADGPAFDLHLEECDGVDGDALLERLELELLDVAPSLRELGAPPVVVRCSGETVHIEIGDPATGKTVAREVPRPSAGAERAIALSVAELYIASWLELLVQPEPESAPAPEPAPEAEARAPAAAELRGEARRVARRALTAPAGPWGSLGVEAGVGLRDVAEPFASFGGGLRASLHPSGDFGLVLATGLARGRAERQRGSVVAWWGSVELGVAWRALRRGPLQLAADLRAGILYARIEGRAAEGVRAESHAGLGARAALVLRPALVAGRFRGGLALTLGVDLRAPTGLVSGEAPVTTGGFFAVLAVDLGAILGRQR